MAQGLEVAEVVASWSERSEPVDVVDVGGDLAAGPTQGLEPELLASGGLPAGAIPPSAGARAAAIDCPLPCLAVGVARAAVGQFGASGGGAWALSPGHRAVP